MRTLLRVSRCRQASPERCGTGDKGGTAANRPSAPLPQARSAVTRALLSQLEVAAAAERRQGALHQTLAAGLRAWADWLRATLLQPAAQLASQQPSHPAPPSPAAATSTGRFPAPAAPAGAPQPAPPARAGSAFVPWQPPSPGGKRKRDDGGAWQPRQRLAVEAPGGARCPSPADLPGCRPRPPSPRRPYTPRQAGERQLEARTGSGALADDPELARAFEVYTRLWELKQRRRTAAVCLPDPVLHVLERRFAGLATPGSRG